MTEEAPTWAEIREHIRAENRAGRRELRSYLVVGPKSVYGAEPGTVAELSLTEGEANALIESGHLALVPEKVVPVRQEDESGEEKSDQDDLSDSED